MKVILVEVILTEVILTEVILTEVILTEVILVEVMLPLENCLSTAMRTEIYKIMEPVKTQDIC